MTRLELADKVMKVLEKDHSPEEWKQLYQQLAGDFSDFCKLEECMENIIAAKYGENELRSICANALEQLEKFENDKSNISEEDLEFLSEIFDLD